MDNKHLGMGVMINLLSGMEQKTAGQVKACLGREIASMGIEDNHLIITFSDGISLFLWDDGQSCCEHRYMSTDDTLTDAKGQKLINIEVKAAPSNYDEYGGAHDIEFLEVHTDKQVFSFANHNEHNGYYGGFSIAAELH